MALRCEAVSEQRHATLYILSAAYLQLSNKFLRLLYEFVLVPVRVPGAVSLRLLSTYNKLVLTI